MKSLGAVLLADVAGYSKMMSYDEAGTLRKIKSFSDQILKPAIEKFRGKLIKSLGDGWLIEFKSATDSILFGQQVQKTLSIQKTFDLRMGIHVGDVEHLDGDIFGDAVNIAARLESIAETGELAISSSAYMCLEKDIQKAFKSCGVHTLKNISTPIEIWSTGRINLNSKGLGASGRDSSKRYICIVPFQSPGGPGDNYAKQLVESLAVDLNAKNWIDSIVQQNAANEDYVVSGKITVEGSKAVTLINLNAPGGKSLWSFKVGGNMGNISALASQTSSQMSSQIFLEIMKVRGKY